MPPHHFPSMPQWHTVMRWALYGSMAMLISACNTPTSPSPPASAVLQGTPVWLTQTDNVQKIAINGQPAPPVVTLEHPGRPPANGHLWITGHWNWLNGTYQWQPGRWIPMRRGHIWRAHTWRWHEGHWLPEEGRWEREQHADNAETATAQQRH